MHRLFRIASMLIVSAKRFQVRRALAASIALSFLLESSGSALASNSRGGSAFSGPSLAFELSNAIRSRLADSPVLALIDGHYSRYAAMHASPPTYPRFSPPPIVLPDRHVNEDRHFRVGTFRKGPRMLSQPLTEGAIPRDPRAMSGSKRPQSSCNLRPRCPVPLTASATTHRSASSPQQSVVHRTLSIMPTVQQFEYEADTAPSPATLFVTGGAETGAVSQSMASVPNNASVNETLTYTPYSGAMSFGWISPPNVPNMTSWPAQTYTVTLNVTQPNSNLKITEVKIYRVDANGGPGTAGLAGVADLANLSQSLGTSGTLSFNLSGTAQAASASDRLGVKFTISDTGSTTQSFSYLAGQGSGSGVNIGGTGTLAASTTGFLPWWTYGSGALPGHGRYLFNAGTGNVIVQATDVDVPERGIDLAFSRTYNSQSTHDSGNSDDSVPSDYGDGWTNTFDAHIAYHGSNTISVYDFHGTRYDYTADGHGYWTPPTGIYASLAFDGACGYQWTEPDGTVYYFYSPDLNASSSCSEAYPQDSAYGGRLYQIWGRNHNNFVAFAYAWLNGDATNTSNLTQITATHADGDALILKFGPAVTGGPTELLSVTRPDNNVINYYYDSSGANLQFVHRPGNNAASTLAESYGYNSSHQIRYATSPRYNLSASDGNTTYFLYDTSNRIKESYDYGLVDFTPNDGTSAVLQTPAPASTPLQTWHSTNISGYGTGTVTVTEGDHWTQLTLDSSSRVTQTKKWTGNVYLTTGSVWDNLNNETQTIDERGNITDYAYDLTGDQTAVALPSVALNNGTYRPTYVISYDSNHNTKAVCDPVETHALGLDWTSNPGTSSGRCPSQAGVLHYTWTATGSEPNGELTAVDTAAGYHVSVSYTAQAPNVDSGMPTLVQGALITQQDGTGRTPAQTITYSPSGDVLSVNAGAGATTFTYDSLHRPLSATDADNVSSYRCYYGDGSVWYTESASQHSADGSPTCQGNLPLHADAFGYDADGNTTTISRHFGDIASTTQRWYDGADRLVEIQQPLDTTAFPNTTLPHDLYGYPWRTRYLYDNTNGSGTGVTTDGNTFRNAGHLYKMQEWLPSSPVVAANSAPSSPAWVDVRGWAYDFVDRLNDAYENANGTQPRLALWYDTENNYGLLSQLVYGSAGSGQEVDYSYLANGWLTQISYLNSPSSPTKSVTYDADANPTSITSAAFTGAENRTYDRDGNLASVIEPTSYQPSATVSYGYYGDGARSSVSVSSSSPHVSNSFYYSYRVDGLLQKEQPSWMAGASFAFTYSNAGRLRTESDPYTGQAIPLYNQNGGATGSSITLANRQITYDSFGRQQQVILPEGYTYGSFTYDGEDEPTGFQTSNGLCNLTGTTVGTCSATSVSNVFGARGELLSNTTGASTTTMQSADGFLCTPSSGGCSQSFDARNDRVLSVRGVAYGYDSAGRQSTLQSTGTITRTYDGDSRLVSQFNSSSTTFNCYVGLQLGCDPNNNNVVPNTGVSYNWGPSGSLANLGGPGSQFGSAIWEHWDAGTGRVLLENNGQAVDVGMDLLGVSNATNGITVEDRDAFGELSATHTGNQFTVWSQAPPTHPVGRFGLYNTGGTGSNDPNYDAELASRVLAALRPDGFIDQTDGISFQGVRSADVNTTQWTTPDWFGGYGNDPMSEEPYLWDGNNGLINVDPSGFKIVCLTSRRQAGGNDQDFHPTTVCYDDGDPGDLAYCVIGCYGPVGSLLGWGDGPLNGAIAIVKAVAAHVYVRVSAYDVLSEGVTTNLCGSLFHDTGAAVGLPFVVGASGSIGIILGDPKGVMGGPSVGFSAGPLELGGNHSGMTIGFGASNNEVGSVSVTYGKQIKSGWCDK